jgi:hypothetical protein
MSTKTVRAGRVSGTMERSFDPRDLVLLPVLDASSALALGHKLLTHAKKEELASSVAQSARRLKQSLSALRDAARARFDEGPADSARRRKAHSVVSAAFSAMYGWLDSWARVPEEIADEKTVEANAVLTKVFGDGLKFLQLPYDAAWAEADHRVTWLEEHEAEELFRKLGGLEFLVNLRAAHRSYGEALGITKEQELSESTSIRLPLDRFLERLRDYVVQVAAEASAGDEAAKERARRLLAPLSQWSSRRSSRNDDSQAPAPEAPAVTAPAAPEVQPAPTPPHG